MPVTWTDEAQAKLYALILQVCDVKPSEAQKAEIANRMGSGCTAKAISHKLTALRKVAAAADNGVPPSSAPSATSKKSYAAPKRKTKVRKGVTDEDDEEDGVGLVTPPGTDKKRKLSEVDHDERFYTDGIDVAVGEDIGQGFRRTRVKSEDSEEDDGL